MNKYLLLTKGNSLEDNNIFLEFTDLEKGYSSVGKKVIYITSNEFDLGSSGLIIEKKIIKSIKYKQLMYE